MKALYAGGVCVAAAMTLNMAAFAQQTGAQAPATRAGSAQAPADQQVTLNGCIQREADFRQARDAGRGGVAGTGVGVANEFVLVNASPATGRAGTTAEAPTGTAGSVSANFELTGPNEGQAAQHVGQRVEITGKLKPAEVGASGRPTGGATAGKPPEGIDLTSKDLRLRELEVGSIRQATGTCPAK